MLNDQNKNQINKHRKDVQFKLGDLVCVRKGRLPSKKRSKFLTWLDGPFEILEKVNPDAYKVNFLREHGVSATFNVTNLRPYFDEEHELPSLRVNSFQAKGDNGDQEPMSLMSKEAQKLCQEVKIIQEILHNLHRS